MSGGIADIDEPTKKELKLENINIKEEIERLKNDE